MPGAVSYPSTLDYPLRSGLVTSSHRISGSPPNNPVRSETAQLLSDRARMAIWICLTPTPAFTCTPHCLPGRMGHTLWQRFQGPWEHREWGRGHLSQASQGTASICLLCVPPSPLGSPQGRKHSSHFPWEALVPGSEPEVHQAQGNSFERKSCGKGVSGGSKHVTTALRKEPLEAPFGWDTGWWKEGRRALTGVLR